MKINQKIIKKRRKELDMQRQAQREIETKQQHWMCCPKCGNEMVEINISGILLDRCTHCNGMYADVGELELLLDSKKSSKFLDALKHRLRE